MLFRSVTAPFDGTVVTRTAEPGEVLTAGTPIVTMLDLHKVYLRLHYTTLGAPTRDAAGHVNNAVIVMHGTTGSGHPFATNPGFAGELFGKDQPLDIEKYYIILPDAIGHGRSSKPSDGLHAKFPHYTYDDMVRADYLLLHDGLKVDHLRLVMGTSMGAMHTWVWGEMYPEIGRAHV